MTTYELAFSGEVLRRGFWLYVWEIKAPGGRMVYYVGRTGDSSSTNDQSPFNRMGQHLGFNAKSNVIRSRLEARDIKPEACEFRLVAHGPVLPEATTLTEHRSRRDSVAAIEKALADAMAEAGYETINTVHCSRVLDPDLFATVHAAFAERFERLKKSKGPQPP